MSAASPVKNGKQPARSTPVSAQAATPIADHINGAAPGGKKKKKKKGKGKSAGNMSNGTLMHHVMDDGDGDMPELEPYKAPAAFAHTRTGLSPDLESVHLSTTASLASLSAARQGADHLNANENVSPAAHAELLTELYRKVGFDAANAVEDEMRKSLDSLPGMRNFVQSALASMAGLGLATDEVKQRTLHAIAQQMLQSGGVGVGVGMGPGGRTATQGTTRNGTAHTNGAPPLEPGTLSELALTQALESLVSGKGTVPTRGGAAGQTALHANVVLSHEFLDDEEGVFEDEMYSEDEMDERHEAAGYAHADGTYAYAHGWNAGVEGVYCELEEEAPPGAYPHSEVHSPMSDGMPKIKNKKRRKPEMPDADPDAAVSVPDTCSSPNSNPLSIQQPSAMTPSRNAPPPSSRAAGKQPMAYAPSTPAATTTPANNAPPRSARAAAKAPAPPQTYANHSHPHHNPSPPASNVSAPQKHRPPGGSAQSPAGTANAKSNSKIWSTNTTEERERIKEFWLGLSESERRALVKIEKETVLKRMKEQQKHSCTCAVCGRKRNAIEEELEVLYEAYYEELEQYANYQQRYASSGGTLPPPPGPGPFPGSVELDKNGLVVGPGGKTHAHSHPPPARAKSTNALTNGPKKGTVPESEFDEDDPDGDDYEEEEYDDEEEEDEEDEEEDVDAEDDVDIRNRTAPRSVAARDRNRAAPNGTKANGRDDLFNFGSSLTVAGPGNILTVADDLLKNDGQKFLEMMEQLAERRMQREEDAAGDVEDESEEEEEDEGDEEDDGEEDEDEEDEEDEEEALTEEQKMEEGKRMFSIFAARMFEQRVLGAYREKVAQERQLQLLQELAEEETAKNQKEAKKAKENQKKKDKKRQQKMAKEEERAAKAAERAAEEAALKERQQRLEEEQRKKREEERAKREAARKAAEEERQRKEEERRKRLAEEKELQAERERKRKEKEERLRAERKEREEKERKAREEKEAKLAAERAAEKARKEQQEREEREKRLAKDKEEKAEREAKERLAREQQQARAAVAKARPPPSPRTNAVASGSSRQQQPTVTPKKILNKPSVQPAVPVAPAPTAQPTRQPVRPVVSMQSAPSTPQHAQSSQNSSSSPTAPTNVPPPTPTFPQSASSGIPPPMLSPQRAPFPSATALPSYAGYIPQLPVPPPLGPSPIPRAFGTGPPFEPGFGRGLASAAPIGPPKVGMPSSLTSPIMAPGSSAPTRRMSSAADPGPITRPIAPIARPNGVNGDTPGSAPGSGGASPSRRSPSPKGVLGSSALIADDDEVVSAPSRRVAPGPVGQGWHSPRSSVAAPTPWGNAPPGQGFSPSRAMSGGNVGNVMNLGLWGQPSGPGNPNPNANLNDWHSQPGPHFFGASPFMHHSHSTATPPPHSSSGN